MDSSSELFDICALSKHIVMPEGEYTIQNVASKKYFAMKDKHFTGSESPVTWIFEKKIGLDSVTIHEKDSQKFLDRDGHKVVQSKWGLKQGWYFYSTGASDDHSEVYVSASGRWLLKKTRYSLRLSGEEVDLTTEIDKQSGFPPKECKWIVKKL